MDHHLLCIRYAQRGTDLDGWFFTAENLLDTAKALEPKIEEYLRIENQRRRRRKTAEVFVTFYHPDPRGIYFMLVAYALENLCKGLLVATDLEGKRSSMVKTGEIPKDLNRHNLSTLLQRVGFPLNPEDSEMAFRLERSAVWSARYPIPTKANNEKHWMKTADGKKSVPVWHREGDVEVIKNLVSRVEQFVYNKLDTITESQDG